MSKKRAAQLLKIIGNNFIEIEPPEGGWKPIHVSCVSRPGEKLGKFYIVDHGNIDYINTGYMVMNLVNYHHSLLDLGIKQLEEKVSATLKSRADSSKFPNLHHLLMKFHGLY